VLSETAGSRQRGYLKKNWWDGTRGYKKFWSVLTGVEQMEKVNQDNPGYCGKWSLK